MDGRTYRRTDLRTDGRFNPLIEMLGASKKDKERETREIETWKAFYDLRQQFTLCRSLGEKNRNYGHFTVNFGHEIKRITNLFS